MYPNLVSEMARKKIKHKTLADDPEIDCTISTVSLKVAGKAPITLREAVRIKSIIGTDMSLEELFKWVPDTN